MYLISNCIIDETRMMMASLDDIYIRILFKNGEMYEISMGDEINAKNIFQKMVKDLCPTSINQHPANNWVFISETAMEEINEQIADGMRYVAKDGDGKIYAYAAVPRRYGAYWDAPDAAGERLYEIYPELDEDMIYPIEKFMEGGCPE